MDQLLQRLGDAQNNKYLRPGRPNEIKDHPAPAKGAATATVAELLVLDLDHDPDPCTLISGAVSRHELGASDGRACPSYRRR